MWEILKGIKKITNAWKNFEIEVKQGDLINRRISGVFKGKLKIMETSKKITMNDLFKKIESMDKKFESMDKKIIKGFKNMDKKIDLMLSTPTMQREIDHEVLSKLN
ncbi:MAG: hypothetical protein ACRCWU_00765 [Metamycoplasmataceae bacterium]